MSSYKTVEVDQSRWIGRELSQLVPQINYDTGMERQEEDFDVVRDAILEGFNSGVSTIISHAKEISKECDNLRFQNALLKEQLKTAQGLYNEAIVKYKRDISKI